MISPLSAGNSVPPEELPAAARTLSASAAAAFAQGRLKSALEDYLELVRRFGERPEWLANIGTLQLRLGQVEDSITSLGFAASALPTHPTVFSHLGAALVRAGRPGAALAPLQRATALAPSSVDAHNALGLAYAALNDIGEASRAFAAALAIAPGHTLVLSNWIDALIRCKQLAQAVDVAEAAVRERPGDAGAWFKLGQVRMLTGEPLSARDALVHSARLFPSHSPTHQNLGLVSQWMGRLTEAEEHFREALNIDPTNVDARFGLATSLLKLRRCDEGWELYAAGRSGAPDQRASQPRGRPWSGEPIERGALLVIADQGLGDVLQFARFLSRARERVPRLLVFCSDYHAPLAPLLANVPGVDGVVHRDSGAHLIGACTTISQLPHLLRLGETAFNAISPYVVPPEHALRRWGQRLATLPGRKVGLCWSGNPRPDHADANLIDSRRSLSLAALARIADVGGISLVSLQKGAEGMHASHAEFALADWTDELVDYGETAALVAGLDLVVSVDTSIVHCAGAVGTPVWMLDRYDNCWRWGTDPENAGWYVNLRVFRQPRFGDWAPVISSLRSALVAWSTAG
ncbi:MAG: tetratricopeptide repeat protein [Betaproteobacteria bacterium]